MGDREKGPPEESAKWDYLTLGDWRCTSGWTYPAYVWLWFLAIVGVAVYVVDTYTAVNLLAFDNWSSEVKPAVPIKYSKWIFAVCILLSWVLCIYEWIRAVRVIRRGGVAESFLDPLAVTLQSIRPQGFKRFLVFSELTKSRKGTDYIALFVYFSFKGAIRVIIAEGPRQVVNALTLKGLLTDSLLTQSDERNSFDQFWYNVEQVADKNHMEAAVYCSMLFTLVIWVFSALSLIISAILYLLFLWHYIPKSDGRLSVYCKRKVDRRLAKIVEHKVKAAIEKEQKKAAKVEQKEELRRQKTGELPPPRAPGYKAQPTLPTLGDSPEVSKDDRLPDFPLVRQDTFNSVSTLPAYSARPPTRNANPVQRQPTLPSIDTDVHPGMPPRSGTQTSQWSSAPSYATNAPLLANAGYAGEADEMPAMPPSAISRQTSYSSFNAPFHGRNGSQSSMGSVRDGSMRTYTPGPGPRVQTPMSARPYPPGPMNGPGYGYSRPPPAPRMPLPVRSNTAFGYEHDPQSAMTMSSREDFARPPPRAGTADGIRPLQQENSDSSFSSLHSQQSFSRPVRKPSNQSFRAYTPAPVLENRSASPQDSYEMKTSPAHSQPPQSAYTAFNPSLHSATPAPQEPRRNVTVTGAPDTGDYFGQIHHGVPQRSATAPIEPQSASVGYAGDIFDDYGTSNDEGLRRPSPPASGPQRSATAGPGPQGGQGQWRVY